MLPAKSSLFPYYELLFLGTKIPPSNLFSNTFVVRELSERLTAVVSTLRTKRPNSQNTGILYFVNVLPLELEADRRDKFTHYFVLNVCTFQFQARYWNIKRFCMQRRKEGFETISVFNFLSRSQQAVSRWLRKFNAQGSVDIS